MKTYTATIVVMIKARNDAEANNAYSALLHEIDHVMENDIVSSVDDIDVISSTKLIPVK